MAGAIVLSRPMRRVAYGLTKAVRASLRWREHLPQFAVAASSVLLRQLVIVGSSTAASAVPTSRRSTMFGGGQSWSGRRPQRLSLPWLIRVVEAQLRTWMSLRWRPRLTCFPLLCIHPDSHVRCTRGAPHLLHSYARIWGIRIAPPGTRSTPTLASGAPAAVFATDVTTTAATPSAATAPVLLPSTVPPLSRPCPMLYILSWLTKNYEYVTSFVTKVIQYKRAQTS